MQVDAKCDTQQKTLKTPKKLQHLKQKTEDRVNSLAQAQLKCDQEERLKELEQLKFSTAGRAARALADERAEKAKKNNMTEQAILQVKLQEVAMMERMDKWRGKCQKMMGVNNPLPMQNKQPSKLNTT